MSDFDYNCECAGLKSLQNSDGSFNGDEHGEVDSRFSYCVIASLKILNELHQVDLDKALDFISHCTNADGGFGAMPGGESHAGQIFCCLGVLSILDRPVTDADRLSEWLAWRQLPCGGLNGRPEKLEDVCYSWWVLSSLEMLGRRHWIDGAKLQVFILSCQDPVSGGFSDRPGDIADIFHTLFGIAGLSLLQYDGLAPVDPRYCLPRSFTQTL